MADSGDGFISSVCRYSQFYFVTIASILGTGILGLPVTLSESGFQPFVISFLMCYIVQALSILYFTEVLQKAYYRSVENLRESDHDNAPIHMEKYEPHTYGSDYDLAAKQEYGEFVELRDMVVPSQAHRADTIKRCLPNLHSLGELLLPCFCRQIFTLSVLLNLLCLLVSYSLAGSQAFASLLRIKYMTMIPAFCWTWTFVVIFLHSFIQPIITVLTFLKGTLFAGTVAIVFLMGLKIQNQITNNYSAIGDSFLMSTIALGGLINVMPLMFSKLKQTRDQIIGFNLALLFGLTTCVILNILWCWSILAVVPQRSVCVSSIVNESYHRAFEIFNNSIAEDHCVLSVSLERAEKQGEISTVPLNQILQNKTHPSFAFVAVIVQIFIVISISVSYMTMGSALHHTIKGVVDSYWNPTLEAETSLIKYGNVFQFITVRRMVQAFFSLLTFAIVFAIAMSNPTGFKTILEQAASLFLNIEMGIFLAIMIHKVSSPKFGTFPLPFELPRWFLHLQYLIPVYFITAIVYDIYHISRKYLA